jgi:hypothetical protein
MFAILLSTPHFFRGRVREVGGYNESENGNEYEIAYEIWRFSYCFQFQTRSEGKCPNGAIERVCKW